MPQLQELPFCMKLSLLSRLTATRRLYPTKACKDDNCELPLISIEKNIEDFAFRLNNYRYETSLSSIKRFLSRMVYCNKAVLNVF